MALGPDKRPVRSIGSDAGHCLAAGIVPRARAPRVVDRLMAPDLWSGWGVRTLSTLHPAYNPISYHLGTVWPVEQATFVIGLRRYGYERQAWRVAEGLFALASLFEAHRLPEVVGGTPRDPEHPFPAIYPRANSPQAWSASALLSTMQSLLGLRAFAPLHLAVVAPSLPPWLPEVRLDELRIGDATASLRFFRDRGGRSRYEVLRRDGALLFVDQAPRDSLFATPSRRVLSVASGALRGHGVLRRHRRAILGATAGLALATVIASRARR
jgi:glycogen debranching enzyme